MRNELAIKEIADFWLQDQPQKMRLRLFRRAMTLLIAATCAYAIVYANMGNLAALPWIFLPFGLPSALAIGFSSTRFGSKVIFPTLFLIITSNILTRFVEEPLYVPDVITFSAFTAASYMLLTRRQALALTIFHLCGLVLVGTIVYHFEPFKIIYRNSDGVLGLLISGLTSAIVVWTLVDIQSRNVTSYFTGLQQSAVEIFQLNQDQNLLLSVVLHDFSNDLMKAMFVNERLKSGKHSDDLPLRLNSALGGMVDLVNQLRRLRQSGDFSSGRNSEQTRIGDVLDRVQLGLRDILKARKVSLSIQGGQESEVRAPLVILSACILNNIVGNAIKYSNPDSVVNISVTPQDNLLHVKVENRGPATDRSAFQASFAHISTEPSIEHMDKGMGIGLGIATRFCERLEIGISGEQTVGPDGLTTTTVLLKMPLVTAEA